MERAVVVGASVVGVQVGAQLLPLCLVGWHPGYTDLSYQPHDVTCETLLVTVSY